MKKHIHLLLIPLMPFLFTAAYHYVPKWISSDVWTSGCALTIGILFVLHMENL